MQEERAGRGRKIDFVDKLIGASAAFYYESDE
jgi:hypothetical protein